MKTILVLSDTHKNLKSIESISGIMGECDYVVHLGDFSSDMREYKNKLGDKLTVIDGNCDFFSNGDTEKLFKIEDVTLFCCHGHKYGVKSGLDRLKAKGKELKADLCLFGHTHEATIIKEEGLQLINPGCMTQMSSQKTYCYIVINGKKIISKIVTIKS